MATREDITLAQLHEVLHCDPVTHDFTWRVSRGVMKAGERAGNIHKGYRIIKIYGRSYRAHRLAWFYFTGRWPEDLLDHIVNGTGSDNRSNNLRSVNNQQNTCNRGVPKNSTSGFKGVTWHRQHRKWYAQIMVNGRKIFLGLFDNPVHAAVAYRQAALKYHGDYAPRT